MANTPNLDLVKPAGTDHALVSVINSNSDKIDAGYGTLSEQIGNMGIYTMSSSQELLTVARDTNICPENTVRWINPRNGTVSGGATQYGIACVTKRISTAVSVKIYSDSGVVFSNGWNNGTGAWNGWKRLEKVGGVPSNTITGDLNNALTPGWYIVDSSCTNQPPERYEGCLLVENGALDVYVRQTYYCGYSNHIYTRTRRYDSGWIWNPWQQLAIKDEECPSKTLVVSGNTKTVTLPNNCRSMIVGTDSADDRCFVFLVNTTNGGVVHVVEIQKGSSVSYDKSVANKLTISVAGSVTFMIFAGNSTILNGITIA